MIIAVTTSMYTYRRSTEAPPLELAPSALWAAVSDGSLSKGGALSRSVGLELTYLDANITYHKVRRWLQSQPANTL